MSVIQLTHISKTYQDGSFLHTNTVHAVQNISFQIQPGECFAIVGESGSGKSTLLRMIGGLEEPTDGQRFFRERPYQKRMCRATRRAIQIVYQNSFEAVNPRFTAAQVVEEPVRYFHLAKRNRRRTEVVQLLQKVGIPACEADKKVHEFSGGQLQRICIARALAAKPEVILLDEPLSSLDVSVQAQIINLLKDLQKEYDLTYILVSHDLEVVYNLSDHIVVMYAGQIVEELTNMARFFELRHPYTKLLLNDASLSDTDLMTDSTETCSAGCAFALRCPFAMERCRKVVPQLTEVSSDHWIACHLENSNETI